MSQKGRFYPQMVHHWKSNGAHWSSTAPLLCRVSFAFDLFGGGLHTGTMQAGDYFDPIDETQLVWAGEGGTTMGPATFTLVQDLTNGEPGLDFELSIDCPLGFFVFDAHYEIDTFVPWSQYIFQAEWEKIVDTSSLSIVDWVISADPLDYSEVPAGYLPWE